MKEWVNCNGVRITPEIQAKREKAWLLKRKLNGVITLPATTEPSGKRGRDKSAPFEATSPQKPPLSTNNFLDVIPRERPRGVYVQDDWVEKLGDTLARLYGLIMALSHKTGSSFMSDKAFAAKMNCSIRQAKRRIKALEDINWIYRNTYNTRKGRKRYIVPHHLYSDYWNNFLNRPLKIKEYVRKRFTDKTGFEPPKKPISPSSPSQKIRFQTETKTPSAPCLSEAPSAPCILLRNKRGLQERETTKGVVFSCEEKLNEKEEVLKSELENSNHSQRDFDIALRYARANPDKMKEVRNPVAWIRAGLQKGWLEQELNNPSSPEAYKEKNTRIAQDTEKQYKIPAKNAGIRVEARPTYIEFRNTTSACQPIIIEYKDPSFEEKLGFSLSKTRLRQTNAPPQRILAQ